MTTSAQVKMPASGTEAAPVPSKKASQSGQPATPGSAAPAPRPGTPARRKGSFLALLAMLLALAAGGASYYTWQTEQNDLRQLAATLESIQMRSETLSGETRTTLPALENRLNESQTTMQSIALQMGELQSAQAQVNEAINSLHAEVNRDRTNGWMVAEAEYLVRLAGARLKLAGDVDTAIAALLAADERLKSTGDPSLITARSAIADDINALQSVTVPDITGMALSLSSLQQHLDDLPLSGPESAAQPTADTNEPATGGWQAAVDAAWAAIRNLVVITHESGGNQSPLLSPDQQMFLRQNLGLKLEAARLALLQRDTAAFQDSLKTARTWITTYFQESTARRNMLDSLSLLENIELAPDIPEVSASLQALRNRSGRRGDDTAKTRAPQDETVASQPAAGDGRP